MIKIRADLAIFGKRFKSEKPLTKSGNHIRPSFPTWMIYEYGIIDRLRYNDSENDVTPKSRVRIQEVSFATVNFSSHAVIIYILYEVYQQHILNLESSSMENIDTDPACYW